MGYGSRLLLPLKPLTSRYASLGLGCPKRSNAGVFQNGLVALALQRFFAKNSES